MQLMTPVSPGELLDKLTILEIKVERIADAEKRVNVVHEKRLLENVWQDSGLQTDEVVRLRDQLKAVNEQLWDIEDGIRDEERAGRFGDRFIELARSVYITNDERAALKKAINQALGSEIVEEKSYSDYRSS